MSHTKIRFVLAIAMTSAALCAADNSIGTWKRNIAKTSSPNSNPYTSHTAVRETAPGGLKVTTTGTRKDGSAANNSFTAKFDGKFVPVAGGTTFDTIALKQVDDNTISVETKKTNGKYHMKGLNVVAKDGKSMTLNQKGTSEDGKPLSLTVVWDKQ